MFSNVHIHSYYICIVSVYCTFVLIDYCSMTVCKQRFEHSKEWICALYRFPIIIIIIIIITMASRNGIHSARVLSWKWKIWASTLSHKNVTYKTNYWIKMCWTWYHFFSGEVYLIYIDTSYCIHILVEVCMPFCLLFCLGGGGEGGHPVYIHDLSFK